MSGISALRYYCHRCQSDTSVFRAPMPICVACQSPFVEELHASNDENELRSGENEETEHLSEQLNNRLAFQLNREQVNGNNSGDSSSSSMGEPVTDDGDENYEDIDEEDEDEDDNDEGEEDNDDNDEGEEDNDDNDEREEDSYESGESDLESQPLRIHDGGYEEGAPWSRHNRRNTIDGFPRSGYGVFDYYNNPFTRADDYQYHHHGLRRHRHLRSDVIPVVEHLLNTLSTGGEGPDGSMSQDMLHNLDSPLQPVQRVAASPEQIEKLEKRELQKGDTDVETECIICQETFGIDAELIKMPCKHEYHGKCIRHWLSISTTCPMCRSPLPADERPSPRAASEEGEQQQQHEHTATMQPRIARTLTFQSAAGYTTVGIWIADPNALPSGLQHLGPHYVENDDDDYIYNDDDDDDAYGYDYDYENNNEFDADYNEDDGDDEDDLLQNFGHPMLHMCPHGFPHPVVPTLRQSRSNTATRTEQQQNSRQINPMDDVD